MARCVCCEKSDNGEGLYLSKNLSAAVPDRTVICMDCLILGARYIVMKAREALSEESEHTERKNHDIVQG